MSTDSAQATAQRISALPPTEAGAEFAAMSTKDQCDALVAAGRLGFAEWISFRGRIPTAALKALWPALARFEDSAWFAAYFPRRVRLRHPWNGELDWNEKAIRRPSAAVVVAVTRIESDEFQRTPLYVSPAFASNTIDSRYELSEDEIEAAIASASADASVSPIPGVRVLSNVRAVR